MDRRKFLAAGCAACAGATGLLTAHTATRAAQDSDKMRIRIIYSLHAAKQPGPDWPNVGFDFNPVMERIGAELTKRCPGFEFLSSMANGPEQAQKILDDDRAAAVDGYLVYQMNCWNRVVQTIAKSEKPVLYADFQYAGSGGFLRGALRALVRHRRLAGLGAEAPFLLVAHADGRLTLEDPATRHRVDLESFGPTNSAVFAQLLATPRPAAAPR